MHPHYLAGSYSALERLGLLKKAGDGNVQQQLTHATGDAGRVRGRVHDDPAATARTSFSEHERQMDYPADESYQFSVGSGQSKAAMISAVPMSDKPSGMSLADMIRMGTLPLRLPSSSKEDLEPKLKDREDQYTDEELEHVEQSLTDGELYTLLARELPSEKTAAKASGYPLQGRTTFQGLQISIEQKKGAVRKWKDKTTGEEGSTKMLHPYGYIRMTEGTDGDHVDVYVGPYEEATHAYIVNQMKKPKQNADKRKTWSVFDEQKAMLGFRNATEAKNAYLAQYNDPRFFGSMVVMPMEEFKKKVLNNKNWGRKLASNLNKLDRLQPVRSEMGSMDDQFPGEYLGVVGKNRDGVDSQPGGWEEGSEDLIDRSFRFMDQSDGVRVLDGNTSATPASPAI